MDGIKAPAKGGLKRIHRVSGRRKMRGWIEDFTFYFNSPSRPRSDAEVEGRGTTGGFKMLWQLESEILAVLGRVQRTARPVRLCLRNAAVWPATIS